jgi:ABC-type multidrug transport system ATPase subunit
MPQRFGLYEELSILENLNLMADLCSIKKNEKKELFDYLLGISKLSDFGNRHAGDLSGGMKQKLSLICSLMSKPKLLLLDEPSVGVDPISRIEIMSLVEEYVKTGTNVLWSTSYFNEAEKFDRVIVLNEGKMLYYGSPSELTAGEKNLECAVIKMLGGVLKNESELANCMHPTSHNIEKVIIAKNLFKKFGDFTAVDDVSFEVNRGEILGLIGPNGAGKTTTFKMLCGLSKVTSGEITIMNFNLNDNLSKVRSQLGYMAQKFSLYGNLNVRQNLRFFAGIYGLWGVAKAKKINEMLKIFNLKKYLGTNASQLPLGYKQRLAIACSLMHNPPVLFLDEPTSGVDPLTRHEFWTHLKGLAKKGYTIIMTTHFMEEAENCDKICFIYKGKNIATGTPEEIKKRIAPDATMDDAFIQTVRDFDKNSGGA